MEPSQLDLNFLTDPVILKWSRFSLHRIQLNILITKIYKVNFKTK